MKKTYIQPTVEFESCEVEQMIAASVDGFNKEINNEGADGGDALSRRHGISVWDDDEEF